MQKSQFRSCAVAFSLLCAAALSQNCGSSDSANGSAGTASPGSPATRQASPTPLAPTFSSISQNILTPKCASCHNSTSPQGDVNVTSYDALVHNPTHTDVVVAGKPQDSHLYEMTSSGQMPPGGPALSTAEVQAISDWISQGAPNN